MISVLIAIAAIPMASGPNGVTIYKPDKGYRYMLYSSWQTEPADLIERLMKK
ncbi:hypothetical protein J7M22_02810 [Candidatus Poribacteria bacterium]|nr:hypothetical protein [Candidatus Poribacteria bacterium]